MEHWLLKAIVAVIACIVVTWLFGGYVLHIQHDELNGWSCWIDRGES